MSAWAEAAGGLAGKPGGTLRSGPRLPERLREVKGCPDFLPVRGRAFGETGRFGERMLRKGRSVEGVPEEPDTPETGSEYLGELDC